MYVTRLEKNKYMAREPVLTRYVEMWPNKTGQIKIFTNMGPMSVL